MKITQTNIVCYKASKQQTVNYSQSQPMFIKARSRFLNAGGSQTCHKCTWSAIVSCHKITDICASIYI